MTKDGTPGRQEAHKIGREQREQERVTHVGMLSTNERRV
jgi:hypothetical protein